MPINNPFIKTNSLDSDIATAKLFEHAVQTDLAKINRAWANVPALTDGKRMYINSDEVLEKIMPGYKKHPTETLELLLHHENLHIELKHHKRYFQMARELERLYDEGKLDSYNLTHSEVNIIMDILVHDVLFNKRDSLTEIGIENLAQMRDRNSLKFTFKGKNLESMLEEYARHKKGEDEDKEPSDKKEDSDEDEDGDGESEGIGDTKSKDTKESEDKKDSSKEEKSEDKDTEEKEEDKEPKEKAHGGSSGGEDEKEPRKDTEPKTEKEDKTEDKEDKAEGHHDETDWSKLEERGGDEFITEDEADKIDHAIEKLKRMKVSLSNLTRTLNGLVTDKKERTYTLPSYTAIQGSNLIFKGKRRARTSLYLVFDASGSMGTELATFKKIISESIPQAMNSPCEWFAGEYARIAPYDSSDYEGAYYKGTFKDIMPVHADSGFSDDGDRVIELCLAAEQKGFTPIGVTDGGGGIYRKDNLKQLKRTILVGTSSKWLDLAKEINPNIQTLCIYDGIDRDW